ncbi:MAG: 4Fe-4S dicluster domain-containing protein [bacterium]|jgi:2-oxoglutarate ferredoxin oxidoreductase subunit delta
MAKVEFNEERCKGCELCTTVCPVKIIKLSNKINKLGYHPATVTDMDKCTGCTMCARICPDTVIKVYK